jgi:hypothetical protein
VTGSGVTWAVGWRGADEPDAGPGLMPVSGSDSASVAGRRGWWCCAVVLDVAVAAAACFWVLTGVVLEGAAARERGAVGDSARRGGERDSRFEAATFGGP